MNYAVCSLWYSQCLPFEPPHFGATDAGGTVGGMVAAGWSGPARASVGAVRDYVLAQEGASHFLDLYTDLLRTIGAGYRREGKHYMTLAIGCTGGKHRSVAMSQALAARLTTDRVATFVVHRDLGRE